MLAACEVPMRDTPPPDTLRLAFRCRCGRHLGWFVNGVLHEPNGDVSGLPLVRKCEKCGRRNRRLTAPD